MSRLQHGFVVVLLMIAAGVFLVWKATNTAILYADGLRYIRQAQTIEVGLVVHGVLEAVDHPVYPLAIAAAHRVQGGLGPEDWQRAAQLASVIAGVLLIVPLYLIAVELVGGRLAWMACALTYVAPLTVNTFADVLSEGTFLLFWSWGVWSALRFLRNGGFGWLAPTVGFAALAYFTRPEGLLLPMALVAALFLMPALPATRMNWPRWWAAVGTLVLGPLIVLGPFMAVKGGLDTKPAIARLLGTAPPSAPSAVERNRPLDPDEPLLERLASSAKAVFDATRGAITTPVLLFVPLGLLAVRPYRPKSRQWLLIALLLIGSFLGLFRLHQTGGYCSPRHAMIPALLLVPLAAAGVDRLLGGLKLPGRWFGAGPETVRLGPIFWPLAVAALAAPSFDRLTMRINEPLQSYRLAADWLSEHVQAGEKVVDLTGWTQFYAGLEGYTFADAIYAGADQDARWVVAREAHVFGPWEYCRIIRSLVGGQTAEITLPERAGPNESRVYIFDRRVEGQAVLTGTPQDRVLR